MSSSHEQRRRRSPRRQRQQPPELIDVKFLEEPIIVRKEKGEQQQENNVAVDWNLQRIPPRGVRIIIPSCITPPPPPPQEPPPTPSEILGVVVLGEERSGKTSLVRRFIHRTSTTESQQRKQASWTVEYHKKDVAFWYTKNTARCVRMQLWDVGGGRTVDHSPQRNAEVVQLLQRTKAIILVVSMEHGPQHVLKEARAWKRWLDDLHIDHDKPVYWFLHKSDVMPNIETTNSIYFGAAIADTSRELGFSGWHLTSCETDDGRLVEDAMMKIIRSNLRAETAPSLSPTSASSTDSKTLSTM